jgi:hypothetical protein
LKEISYAKNKVDKVVGIVCLILGLAFFSFIPFFYLRGDSFGIPWLFFGGVGGAFFGVGFVKLFEKRNTIINSVQGYVQHRSGCFPIRKNRKWSLSSFSRIQISDNYKMQNETTVYYGVCLVGDEMNLNGRSIKDYLLYITQFTELEKAQALALEIANETRLPLNEKPDFSLIDFQSLNF